MARSPLPRTFWVLWVGILVNRAGTFVEPFLIIYLTTQRGLSAASAGTVLVAFGAGAFASQLLGGGLADHLGRRVTVVGGMAVSFVALLSLGAARTMPELLVAAFLVGVVGDIHRPAVSALVADLVEPAERPRAYGLNFWAVNLGFTIAAVAAGYLAEVSFTLIFAIDAVTCLAFAGVVLLGIRHDPPRHAFGDAPEPAAEAVRPPGYGTALRDLVLMSLCGLVLLHGIVYMQVWIALPLSVVDSGLSLHDYGLIAALNGLLIVLFQPWVSARAGGFDRMRTIAFAMLVQGVGFGLTALADTVPVYALTVAVWTSGEILAAGLLGATVADLAPVEARGRYQGVFGTAFGAAAMLAPLFGTRVYQHLGEAALWLACLLIGAVTAIGFLALGPAARRRSGHLVAAET